MGKVRVAPKVSAFTKGVDGCIEILRTKAPVTRGHMCSTNELATVAGPTFSNQLYIDKITEGRVATGTFEEGVKFATSILEKFRLERGETPGTWELVPADHPDVAKSMFVAAMYRLVDDDG
jgi:hypothetical protein